LSRIVHCFALVHRISVDDILLLQSWSVELPSYSSFLQTEKCCQNTVSKPLSSLFISKTKTGWDLMHHCSTCNINMVIGTLLIDMTGCWVLLFSQEMVMMAGVLDISLYIFSSMCQLIKVNTKSISDDDFRNNICTRKYSKKSASAVHRLTYGIIFIIYSAHQVLVQKKSNGTAWVISFQAWSFLADHGNVFLPVVCLCVMLVYCR